MLLGDYAKKVAGRISKVSPCYKPIKKQLRCGFCGYKAKYDLGLVVFKAWQWKEAFERQKNSGIDRNVEHQASMTDYYQYTGYVRCIQCNGAGNWEVASPFLGLGMMSSLMMGRTDGRSDHMIGEMRLSDGSSPQWISDGEERFLDRLREVPDDSYVWDRLGNLYHKGSRPELAASVFEHSVRIDPGQFGNRREKIPASKQTLDKHMPGSEKKLESIKGGGSSIFSLGTEQRPIIVKVKSEEKGEKVALLCDMSYAVRD
jgi:hypothetical protein